MTLTDSLKFIIKHGYWDNYLILFFVFITLTVSGIFLFLRLVKTNNKLLAFGGGMIVGPVALLVILVVVSYIFKGTLALQAIFLLYSIVTFIHVLRNIDFLKKFFRFEKNIGSLAFLLIFVIYLALIFLTAGGTVTGGDVITYWGLSTSFSRGNYPTVLPWQPDILSGYHHGAFMFQGAIHAITSLSISVVYVFCGIFFVLALFIFLTGMAREKERSIISLLPGIFAFVLFGGPILLTGGYENFFNSFNNFAPRELINNLVLFPHFSDLKSALGAGPNGLNGLYYISFYSFALMPFLLFFYLITNKTREFLTTRKSLFLIILMLTTISIDESFFFLEIPFFVFYFVLENLKAGLKIFFVRLFTYLLIFLAGFFLTQSMIRDSFFTPKPIEAPKFVLLLPNQFKLLGNLGLDKQILFWDSKEEYLRGFLIDAKLYSNGVQKEFSHTRWFLPSLGIIILSLIFLTLLGKAKLEFSLALTAALSLIAGFVLVNPYAPYASYRLITKSYHLVAIVIGMLIVNMLSKRRQSLFLGILLVFLLIPQIIVSNAVLIRDALMRHHRNYSYGVDWNNKTLVNLEKRLSIEKRILFVDLFPEEGWFSELTLNAIQLHGFFVPKMTRDKRVISSDASFEWFDAVTFLSPRAFKVLGVEYVFVENKALTRLPKKRVDLLGDTTYFAQEYIDQSGVLYKVSANFKNLKEDMLTLEGLSNVIPDGKTVYLDKFQIPEVRKGMFDLLANRATLIGPSRSMANDYFAYIETFHPFTSCTPRCLPDNEALASSVDYIVSEQENDFRVIGKQRFKKIAEIPKVFLWQKVN